MKRGRIVFSHRGEPSAFTGNDEAEKPVRKITFAPQMVDGQPVTNPTLTNEPNGNPTRP